MSDIKLIYTREKRRTIRLSKEELLYIEQEAKRLEISISEYIRRKTLNDLTS